MHNKCFPSNLPLSDSVCDLSGVTVTPVTEAAKVQCVESHIPVGFDKNVLRCLFGKVAEL